MLQLNWKLQFLVCLELVYILSSVPHLGCFVLIENIFRNNKSYLFIFIIIKYYNNKKYSIYSILNIKSVMKNNLDLHYHDILHY